MTEYELTCRIRKAANFFRTIYYGCIAIVAGGVFAMTAMHIAKWISA